MKLPPPFEKAKNVKANLDGTISLIDDQGQSLARLPLATAFDLSPEADGYGFGSGFGYGDGYGYGFGYGSGYGVGDGSNSGYGDGSGDGDGVGDVYGDGDGDGSGRSK